MTGPGATIYEADTDGDTVDADALLEHFDLLNRVLAVLVQTHGGLRGDLTVRWADVEAPAAPGAAARCVEVYTTGDHIVVRLAGARLAS